jgi:hypothetical protein
MRSWIGGHPLVTYDVLAVERPGATGREDRRSPQRRLGATGTALRLRGGTQPLELDCSSARETDPVGTAVDPFEGSLDACDGSPVRLPQAVEDGGRALVRRQVLPIGLSLGQKLLLVRKRQSSPAYHRAATLGQLTAESLEGCLFHAVE